MDGLSDEELELIDARTNAATPGPWLPCFEGRDHTSGDTFIRTPMHDLYINSEEYIGGGGHFGADLDFIAHAREDVPRLLLEIRRLKSVIGSRAADPNK
ncbi:MAG TPA: hypothetical protein VFN10_07680 [Thermoanaerobaculia bacterium]|nr:hypothetical protein [Thermoanaerobaculia bacterium]